MGRWDILFIIIPSYNQHIISMDQEPLITASTVLNSYSLLSSQSRELRRQANTLLNSITDKEEVWQIAQELIGMQELQAQFLGAQLLYQKVGSQLMNLPVPTRHSLRQFVFGQLERPQNSAPALLDRLSSVGAVLVVGCILEDWPEALGDLVAFMGINEHNTLAGLWVLQRIPEILRNTSQLTLSTKNSIMEEFLKQEEELCAVLVSLAEGGSESIGRKSLQAMECWAQVGLSFLKYPHILTRILEGSLTDTLRLGHCLALLLETVRGRGGQAGLCMSEWEPTSDANRFCAEELQTITIILDYVLKIKDMFLGENCELTLQEQYLETIKQIVLKFGFLMAEKVGFDLLDILLLFTSSPELWRSHMTFSFWEEFLPMMSKCQGTHIKNHLGQYVGHLFELVSSNAMIKDESLLEQPDLQLEVTIDDLNTLTLEEYREAATSLLQAIYRFLVDASSPQLYLDRCLGLVGAEGNQGLGVGTELALFCIKAPIEAIAPAHRLPLCGLVELVMDGGTGVWPRIAAMNLQLMRECCVQMCLNPDLQIQAIDYSLFYLKEEGLTRSAAAAFRALVTGLGPHQLSGLGVRLLGLCAEAEPGAEVVEYMIEGLFILLSEAKCPLSVGELLRQLLTIIQTRFQATLKGPPGICMIPLKEMEVVGSSFPSLRPEVKFELGDLQMEILSRGLQMACLALPHCPSMQSHSDLTLSLYKRSLQLNLVSEEHLGVLDETLRVLERSQTGDRVLVLELVYLTLAHCSQHHQTVALIDHWLTLNMPLIDSLCIRLLALPTVDVLGSGQLLHEEVEVGRLFFQLQEGLLEYSLQIFLRGYHTCTLRSHNTCTLGDHICTFGNHTCTIGLALLWLSSTDHRVQRRAISFLLACSKVEKLAPAASKILEGVLASMGVLGLPCYGPALDTLFASSRKVPDLPTTLARVFRQSPYQNVSPDMVSLLVGLLTKVLTEGRGQQSKAMSIMARDLARLAKNGQTPDLLQEWSLKYAYLC